MFCIKGLQKVCSDSDVAHITNDICRTKIAWIIAATNVFIWKFELKSWTIKTNV